MDTECKSTVRDMIRGILEDVETAQTIEEARRISNEYMDRGVFIRPEYLLEVWTQEK